MNPAISVWGSNTLPDSTTTRLLFVKQARIIGDTHGTLPTNDSSLHQTTNRIRHQLHPFSLRGLHDAGDLVDFLGELLFLDTFEGLIFSSFGGVSSSALL